MPKQTQQQQQWEQQRQLMKTTASTEPAHVTAPLTLVRTTGKLFELDT